MAHSLKLKVVAEGVETAAQLAFLANSDCDEMQGDYFARPQPAEQCTQLLREQRRMSAGELPSPRAGEPNSPLPSRERGRG